MKLISSSRFIGAITPPKEVEIISWISNNVPGYSWETTPYFRELALDIVNPVYEEIVVSKSSQIGWIKFGLAILAYFQSVDPCDVLYVLPTDEKLKDECSNKVLPHMESVECLREKITRKKDNQIKFLNTSIYFASANNSKTLKSKSTRIVFGDEVSEIPTDGVEDAIQLAKARAATFSNRKFLWGSTPRSTNDALARLYSQAQDHRKYHVPCPHCGAYQPLVWEQLDWSAAKTTGLKGPQLAAEIDRYPETVFYRCVKCPGRITHKDKRKAVSSGVWLSESQWMEKGAVCGVRPAGKRVGYEINSMYSLFFPWSRLVSDWVSICHDWSATRGFLSQQLARLPAPPKEQSVGAGGVSQGKKDLEFAKQLQIKKGVIPAWAGSVVVGCDQQKDRLYYVVLALGRSKSQLIDYGTTHDFEVLYSLLDRPYPTAYGKTVQPNLLFIDFGGYYKQGQETEPGEAGPVDDTTAKSKAFHFARRSPKIIPVRGNTRLKDGQVLLESHEPSFGRNYINIQVDKIKEKLMVDRENGLFLLHADTDQSFIDSIDSEKYSYNSDGKITWSHSSINHYLDCVVYGLSAGVYLKVNQLPDEATLEQRRLTPQAQKPKADLSKLFPKVERMF